MNPVLRHLPFAALGSSATHQRFLDDDPRLAAHLGTRARTVEEFLARAPRGAQRLVPAAELSAALVAYAERHGAPEASLANARLLAQPDTHVIVTGQQPGLLGGPLFSLHKAATAVRLCREIARVPGAPRVVPLFWNHTDDHDLDEANRLFLPNAAQELQRFRLELEHHGEALRHVRAGSDMQRLLAEVEPLLQQTEFREWALGCFRPRGVDEPLGAGFARMLFEVFGSEGLVVIEARDLPRRAFDVLGTFWSRAGEVRTCVRAQCDQLRRDGLDVTIDPESTLMFRLEQGRRVALADGESIGDVTQASPGALLRPVWQDAVLPTLGFVAGPGELGYLSVVGAVYRLLGVAMPVLVPRASLTLVEPSLQRLLQKFALDLTDLEAGPEALAARLQGPASSSALETAIDEAVAALTGRLDALAPDLARLDPSLTGALERARDKARDEAAKLTARVRKVREEREGTGQRQLRRLCSVLRPRGRLQERVLPGIGCMLTHGPAIGPILTAAADPFATTHGVLEL